ncbi:NAD-dependent deacetylase sirtuin 2 homolog [Plakobranchus ocellatus]|uniref:NAD-dependent deacetylase sirtuin 2 homolog n=1 Tax=Plakobranchus ocellatus TaxID=259542 RepID=A0AAV4ABN7_9GAST|nr:NAD-dependent deacetylase sirtuin 2 homolog [Plakobranchus ocellatus]
MILIFILFASLSWRDVFKGSTCDEGCQELADLLGWGDELKATVQREHARIDKENLSKPSSGSNAKANTSTGYAQSQKSTKGSDSKTSSGPPKSKTVASSKTSKATSSSSTTAKKGASSIPSPKQKGTVSPVKESKNSPNKRSL